MQKIATKVFIYASIAFGVIGLVMVVTMPEDEGTASDFNMVMSRLLMATVFIILPSFALSVASKYLRK